MLFSSTHIIDMFGGVNDRNSCMQQTSPHIQSIILKINHNMLLMEFEISSSKSVCH